MPDVCLSNERPICSRLNAHAYLKGRGTGAMMPRRRMRARARTRLNRAAAGAMLLAGLGACSRPPAAPPAKPWKVTVLQLDDGPETQAIVEGLTDELRKSSLQPERDYLIAVQSAHGIAGALPELAEAAVRDGAHTLVAIGTPALQAARAASKTTPVVFTDVGDPALAGVTPPSIWSRWLPFLFPPDGPPLTGAYAAGDFAPLLEASGAMLHGRLGAVVVGADRDALGYRDGLRQAA